MADVSLDLLMRFSAEDDGCLVWTGACGADGTPQLSVDGKAKVVRRVVWELMTGRPPGMGVYVLCDCDTEKCWHPDHLCVRSRSAVLKGRPKSLTHRLKVSAAARARSRLTPDVVAAIRASDAPASELDRLHGLSAGHARQIQMGKVWRNYGSPFAGLEAAGRAHGR